MSVKDKLQIILITYNRRNHLEKTFSQLFCEESPIKDFHITVLDNNSTDGTQEYVKEFMKSRPNLIYKKNNHNLGLSGNIAMAMETAEKEYVWIICDDDKYDWSNWGEVEKAINDDEDFIIVSRYALSDEQKNNKAYWILQASFLPASIVNTRLYTDISIRNAFDNIFTLFPHIYPLINLLNHEKPVYIVDKAIVDNGMDEKTDCSYIRGQNSDELSQRTKTMSWIVGFANASSMLKDVSIKHEAMNVFINDTHKGMDNFCVDMLKWYGDRKNWMQLFDIWLQLDSRHSRALIKKILMTKIVFPNILPGEIKDRHKIINIFGIKIKFRMA